MDRLLLARHQRRWHAAGIREGLRRGGAEVAKAPPAIRIREEEVLGLDVPVRQRRRLRPLHRLPPRRPPHHRLHLRAVLRERRGHGARSARRDELGSIAVPRLPRANACYESHSFTLPRRTPRYYLYNFNTPKKGLVSLTRPSCQRTQHVRPGRRSATARLQLSPLLSKSVISRMFLDTGTRVNKSSKHTTTTLVVMCATLRQSRIKSTSATRTRDQPNWPRVHHYCLGQDRGLDMGVKPMPSAGAASLSSRSSAAIRTGLRSGCAPKPSR